MGLRTGEEPLNGRQHLKRSHRALSQVVIEQKLNIELMTKDIAGVSDASADTDIDQLFEGIQAHQPRSVILPLVPGMLQGTSGLPG